MSAPRRKLIEVAMPLEVINVACDHESKPGIGPHPRSLHHYWARRRLASCRATLFCQLVDDPSSWPKLFPTETAQDAERRRLFDLVDDLVQWKNSNNPSVIHRARREIARSLARSRIADGEGSERDEEILAEKASTEKIEAYLVEFAPPIHDPFAGGGSIPLEAQRLGLRAIATDLNPVAVLINKALIEIPPKFAGQPPIHPEAESRTEWKGTEGLAEDVRRYGDWVRDKAKERIGHLYPKIDLPEEYGGGKANVIAWIWARTVESPNPAFRGVHVPLVSNFFLSTKKGKEHWVEPVLDGQGYHFEIRSGTPPDPAEIKKGTKLGRGANFRCLMSGTPMEPEYIKQEGKAKRMGARLMAIVAEGNRKRIYLPPSKEMEKIAASAEPSWAPEQELNYDPRAIWCPAYGLETYADLFTPRQLVALTTLSDLVQEARDRAVQSYQRATAQSGGTSENQRAEVHCQEYGDAIAVYLSCALARIQDYNCSLSTWLPSGEQVKHLFTRQAIPMVWDYAESNLFASRGITFSNAVDITAAALLSINRSGISMPPGIARANDAKSGFTNGAILCCDPPYYDNIGYADLSDFFYVWHRRTLRGVYPDLFSTIQVPKSEELIASPYRHGSPAAAEEHFLAGIGDFLQAVHDRADESAAPSVVYYAFKQSEKFEDGVSSTGWSTFLQGLVGCGYSVVGTWPSRTESAIKVSLVGSKKANMLASSIVMACRRRPPHAPRVSRGDFLRELRSELPDAIRVLEQVKVAPVDMAQASIGPGMGVFSRFGQVMEADDSPMSARSALQLINEVVDEVRSEEESDFDRATRFALTWFEGYGFGAGPYGEAETLATARGVAVRAVADAGLLHASGGSVRLLQRDELPRDWDPNKDQTLTVWECTQHLIRTLESESEAAAADLLARMGPRADAARTLAYRLYTHCGERAGWAEEARAYNGLVVAWPELEAMAGSGRAAASASVREADLFSTDEESR